MFFKIGALKNFAIFTGKHVSWNLFLIKLQPWRCFPVNIAKFLRTAFCIEHLWWLFLNFLLFFLESKWHLYSLCSKKWNLKHFQFALRFHRCLPVTLWCNPLIANIYLFKFKNRNTRKRCEICLQLTSCFEEVNVSWVTITFLTIMGKLVSKWRTEFRLSKNVHSKSQLA